MTISQDVQTRSTDRNAVHPCFSIEARQEHSRIHLPVAPRCNVQCQFCNRKFDCVNESRPGVSAQLLRPDQAVWYLERMLAEDPSISVVGIAGPGDPFANAEETMSTFRRVHQAHPELALCVASNGLGIQPHIPELARLGVGHVTITVNAIEPDIAGRVYRWIRDGDEVLRGADAGRRICTRQAAAIRSLVRHGITVKVNCICIPGVNDAAAGGDPADTDGSHVLAVAAAARALGAERFNLMSLHPVAGTAFADIPAPDPSRVRALRAAAQDILPQMAHCSRCRADAAGKVGCGTPDHAYALMKEASAMSANDTALRPHVAVCSREGVLVNQHLGHAEKILIYAEEPDCFRLVDVRPAPEPGMGEDRWQCLVDLLHDCRAVVANAAGPTPEAALGAVGISIRCTEGMIEDALELVFAGRSEELREPSCSGPGGGCGGSCSGGGNAAACA